MGQGLGHMQDLGYYDPKRGHNLKCYTWVEQQGKRMTRSRRSGTTPTTGPVTRRSANRSTN